MKKILLYIVLIIIIGIGGLLSYLKFALPDVGEPERLSIKISNKRIKRGKYLAENVMMCIDCHSIRDFSKFGGPIKDGTYALGGEVFDQRFGLPGSFVSKNLTPYYLGDWTDGELVRAITAGVNKKGEALFPIMPHPNFGKASREDIYSIVAYLRSLEPKESKTIESFVDFPMNFIINTLPKPAQFSSIPSRKDQIAYGKYMFTIASCADCHTMKDHGQPIEGMELAGGMEFTLPSGTVRSANITTDEETGIGGWSENAFLARFKMYTNKNYTPSEVKKGDYNTVMPWFVYGHMKDHDLKAIYAYLQTVKPVHHTMARFTPAE